MFKDITLFRILSNLTTQQIEDGLAKAAFMPCGASQEKSVGWVPPRAENGLFMEVIHGQGIAKLMIEAKKVPAEVIDRHVKARVEIIEQSTGRKPGKKELRELKEDIRLSLLPSAFTQRSAVMVWVELESGIMAIGSTSSAKNDEVLTAIVRSVDGAAIQHFQVNGSVPGMMSMWLAEQVDPDGFSIGRKCQLVASDESKAKVKYDNHNLFTDEVQSHVRGGKVPTSLAMNFCEKASFVLTDTMGIKGIDLLDVALEQSGSNVIEADKFDADVVLYTSTLKEMIAELVSQLGGEAQPQGEGQ